MHCCANCFHDSFLNQYINTKSTNISNCNFCESVNVICIAPQELSEYFLPLLDLYIESDIETACHLFQLLKKDWCLFEELDDSVCQKLLQIILSDESLSLKKYAAKIKPSKTIIDKWEKFRQELKHSNRFFPEESIDKNKLNNLLGYLLLPNSKTPKLFYRARISPEGIYFNIDEMGKPPANHVGNGRANPLGISYLYTASDSETALSEIRPNIGDIVRIAKFSVIENLNLLDLRHPKKSISPFAKYDNELEEIVYNIDFLCHLGEELSKPIVPREANLEYLPSQYLCELIKHFNYDGVMYKSSVGKGDNFAIFNDHKLIGTEVSANIVTNNTFSYDSI